MGTAVGSMGWVYFKYDDKDYVKPTKYGRYLICRKDGKIHLETWNNTGWAYNHKEVRFYMDILPPIVKRQEADGSWTHHYTMGKHGNEN